MKLISMTDFVLEQKEIWNNSNNSDLNDTGRCIRRTAKYANFLKQPLEIWMFVPCDEEGGFFEEPICYVDWVYCNENGLEKWFSNENELNQYQQAKERCLFEGFEYNSETEQLKKGRLFLFFSTNFCEAYLDGDTKYLEFIEEIADYDLQLTLTAQKQIGCDH